MTNIADSLGQVIASRSMNWTDASGQTHPALVEIEVPRPDSNLAPDPSRGPWCCRVRLQGLGDDRVYTIFGADSLQALHLTLAFAGQMVARSKNAADLDWSAVPNWGFPLMPASPTEVSGAKGTQ